MKKRTFTIKIVAGALLLVGTSMTMQAQTKKTFVTMYGEKIETATADETKEGLDINKNKLITVEGANVKANLDSPAFTGTPTTLGPVDQSESSLELANVKFVLSKISDVTGGVTIVDASTTNKGIVRLATLAESKAASEILAVTPSGLIAELAPKADAQAVSDALALKADLDSPKFKGVPTREDDILDLDDNSNQLATTAFVKANVTANVAEFKTKSQEFVLSAPQSVFTLTTAPSDETSIKVLINGVRIINAAISVSGSDVTYNPTDNGDFNLSAGDIVVIDYN